MLRRARIKNYKSLAAVDVELERLTVLVGPNGAGKSNVIDALRFVADSLNGSVSLALQDRGGIQAVRRRSRGHPTHFGLHLWLEIEDGVPAEFAFEVAARTEGSFAIQREECRIGPLVGREGASYEVQSGQFIREVPGIRPRIEPDRLALSIVSAVPEYRPVYEALRSMRFYSLQPERIRALQDPDVGEVLMRDGRNAASVLREIISRGEGNGTYERICRLLEKIVPGTTAVHPATIGSKQTLQFSQEVNDANPWPFEALNMSDGTLRALGMLLAIYQVPRPWFLAFEEPEVTIHPGALDVIVDVLHDATSQSQVVVTTHSPDMLDSKRVEDRQIRLVSCAQGQTSVMPLGELTRRAIRDRLYSAGELLRMDELAGEPTQTDAAADAFNLFKE